MRKDLGVQPAIFPMPVLMVAAYPLKLNALIFDQFQAGYYVATEKVGQAWNAGKALMEAAQADK